MSSHWKWQEEKIKEHNENTPFAPENGEPLRYKVGDKVIYTNDYGVSFELTVTGLYKPEPMDSMYATGYRYLLDKDSYWMPVREGSLCFPSEKKTFAPSPDNELELIYWSNFGQRVFKDSNGKKLIDLDGELYTNSGDFDEPGFPTGKKTADYYKEVEVAS